MTTETTDQRIERLEAELAAAKAERDRPKVWKPERGEVYVCLSAAGPMWQAWSGADADAERYERGNVFRTWEEAERERDRRILIADMRRWAEERGWRIRLNVSLEKPYCNDVWKQRGRSAELMAVAFSDRLHLLSDE